MRLSKIFNAASVLFVFSLLFTYFIHPIPLDTSNRDLGRHLVLGRIILMSGHVPHINLLSYTAPNFPFINTHWLSEVIFYLSKGAIGFNGLILFSALIAVVTFALVFFPSAKKYGVYSSTIVSLVYLQIFSERTQIRPELFSFLILAIFLFVLYKFKARYTKWIFILIPLELIWVNLHIYFIIGVGLTVLFLIDNVITERSNPISRKLLTLTAVTFFVALSTLCNPNFIKGAIYPFIVFNNYGLAIQENMGFIKALRDYYDPRYLYFGVALTGLWLFLITSVKKLYLIDILLAIFFTYLGLSAVRNLPLFMIGTLIIASKSTSLVLERVYRLVKKGKTVFKVLVFVVVVLFIIPAVRKNVENNGFGLGVSDNAQYGVNFLNGFNLKGPVYNNFDIGDYLVYRLYPMEKVFVDGRPEAYPKDFFQDAYFPLQGSQAKFGELSSTYKFNILFIAHTDMSQGITNMLSRLVNSQDWKMVFLNSTVVVFLRNTSENQAVIKTYLVDQNNVKLNERDLSDRNNVMQLANFFGTVDWESQQIDMNRRFLDFEPNNCGALQNVIYLTQKQNIPVQSAYLFRYQQFCH